MNTSIVATTMIRRSCALATQLRPRIRCLSTAQSSLAAASSFPAAPAPPRLPENEQRLYEELQKSSTGAFSTPRPTVVVNQSAAQPAQAQTSRSRPTINQSPHSSAENGLAGDTMQSKEDQEIENVNAKVTASGRGEELHPDIRRGAKPEFEGDRNPKTGEIGGPKNEPLRWGGEVDWSYNGRVTDF